MHRLNRGCFTLAFVALSTMLPSHLAAQTAPPADTAESKADAAYKGHDWALAENSYASLVQQQPANGRFWYRLAVSERAMQHYAPALESFEKARVLGANEGLPGFIVDYEVATTYAAMGDGAQAFAVLKKSADGGFSNPSRVQADPEWNALRKDPQFIALAKQVSHNAAPCEDPEFRQFDFWIGDWDVVATANGIQAGTSHISTEMDGCVIWENWTSAGTPYFGKSYNTYNVNLRRWEQYWVDNTAGATYFYGNLKGNVMDYWTEDIPQPNGGNLRRHLQFFNLSPDKVRQFCQGSTDGGKTWTVQYDLTYTKHVTKTAGAL